MAYQRIEAWVALDELGDYQRELGGTVYPQAATRKIAASRVGVEQAAGGALPPTSTAASAVVTRRRVWVERVDVGRWPRPCVCDEEADDLEAALAAVPDDHSAWRT